jgi:hypothetical protein
MTPYAATTTTPLESPQRLSQEDSGSGESQSRTSRTRSGRKVRSQPVDDATESSNSQSAELNSDGGAGTHTPLASQSGRDLKVGDRVRILEAAEHVRHLVGHTGVVCRVRARIVNVETESGEKQYFYREWLERLETLEQSEVEEVAIDAVELKVGDRVRVKRGVSQGLVSVVTKIDPTLAHSIALEPGKGRFKPELLERLVLKTELVEEAELEAIAVPELKVGDRVQFPQSSFGRTRLATGEIKERSSADGTSCLHVEGEIKLPPIDEIDEMYREIYPADGIHRLAIVVNNAFLKRCTVITPATPESILTKYGFIDSSDLSDPSDIAEVYRDWGIALAIPNGGIIALDIFKGDRSWGKPTENEFDYLDQDGIISHAKAVIDEIEAAIAANQPPQLDIPGIEEVQEEGAIQEPAIRLFVGSHSQSVKGEIIDLSGDRCFTAAYPAVGGKPGKFLSNLNPDRLTVLLDSGAFSDPPKKRLSPQGALERQLNWEKQASEFWGKPWQVYVLASYDFLIDETWVENEREKRRWSAADAEGAVVETIENARFLASQREALTPRKLILTAQGVSADQYEYCVDQILEFATPDDWIGLGGWCILGTPIGKPWLPVFWQVLQRCIPKIAAAGVRHVHIFGCTYLPAISGLLWLADKYGITVSADSSRPILDHTRGDLKKAGARGQNWRESVEWWIKTLADLRAGEWYQEPGAAIAPTTSPDALDELISDLKEELEPAIAPTSAVVMMSAAEARSCVDGIKGHIESARKLLLDLYEREGWKALGYESWRECAVAEFGESKSQLYRELEAAKIERNISPIGEIGSIRESHLRPLGKLEPDQQRKAWEEAVETAPNGKVTAAHVQEVVEKRSPPVQEEIPSLEELFSLYGQIAERVEHRPTHKYRNQFAVERTAHPAFSFYPLGRREAWQAWERKYRKYLERCPLPPEKQMVHPGYPLSEPKPVVEAFPVQQSCKSCQHRHLIGDGSEFTCGAKGEKWTCAATRDWAQENGGCDKFKPFGQVEVVTVQPPADDKTEEVEAAIAPVEAEPEQRHPIYAFDLTTSQYNKLAVHAKAAGMSMVGYLQKLVEELPEA